MISLQTRAASIDEFLSDPPDMKSLRQELRSLSDVPSRVRLSFSPASIDDEAISKQRTEYNAYRLEHGCGPRLADDEDGDLDVDRGWAVFQNMDAGDTDDNAQGVFITTPSEIGTDQDEWSGILNNTKTNTDFFLQSGMIFKTNWLKIVWTDDDEDLAVQPYVSVPYYASTEYQFSNTYTSSTWFMCAGNNDNIDEEYECVESDATGTHLKESRNTSVFFETENSDEDWYDGFPDTISVSDAKTYRDGIGYDWSEEDRWTVHSCDDGDYPVADAMGTTTLKDGGTGTFTLSGIPIVCEEDD